MIDRALVQHVAGLAQLELNEAEIAWYQEHLGKVLAHVAELDVMPDPLANEWRSDVLGASTLERSDVVASSLPPDAALANAPRRVGTAFQVPRIIE